MTRKDIGLIAAGVATGYMAALLIHSDGSTKTSLDGEAAASSLQQSESRFEPADLKGSSSPEKLEAAPPGAAPSSPPVTRAGMMRALEEAAVRNYCRALEEENAQLMAAGFSMDRIQWLRERSEQLEVERRRAETDRRMKGLPAVVDLTYSGDNADLDLRNEIGVEEYERYRKALGRQLSVEIASVLPGGIAESAGLKPGDQITSYAGERVYTQSQITKLDGRAGAKPGGTRVMVVVERDGVPMQFEVPGGALGITSPMAPALPNRSKVFKMGLRNASASAGRDPPPLTCA